MRAKHLLLLLLTAAGTTGSTLRRDPCATPMVATTEWTQLETPRFEFRSPAPISRPTAWGLDTEAWHYLIGDSIGMVEYEYGRYSGAEVYHSWYMEEYRRCTATIDGRATVVATYQFPDSQERMRFVGAVGWRDVRPNEHLTVRVRANSSARRDSLLAVLWSVRVR
jgi:hypothetical protein